MRLRLRLRKPPIPKGPNKTEMAYADYLEDLRLAGVIRRYRFEGIKLKLARKAYYTPDFYVLMADRSVQAHEVKGHMREAARVRLLTAAEEWPEILFILVKRDPQHKGAWLFTELEP